MNWGETKIFQLHDRQRSCPKLFRWAMEILWPLGARLILRLYRRKREQALMFRIKLGTFSQGFAFNFISISVSIVLLLS